MTTTFRQDTITAVKGVGDAYVLAHPNDLKAMYEQFPASFNALPCAFIGDRSEEITGDRSTRTRVLTFEFVVVDKVTTNKESVAHIDELVDGLLDALTAAMRSIPLHGPLSITGTRPVPIPEGAGVYVAEAILLSAETQEGTGL